jgi:hypothetical protein
MSEQKLNLPTPPAENGSDYQAPAIEEVVSREGMEREVAYAGVQGPSVVFN